jgi:hypothetical protein
MGKMGTVLSLLAAPFSEDSPAPASSFPKAHASALTRQEELQASSTNQPRVKEKKESD